MNIHTTHHIYKIALRKIWFWKYFFLSDFSSAAPICNSCTTHSKECNIRRATQRRLFCQPAFMWLCLSHQSLGFFLTQLRRNQTRNCANPCPLLSTNARNKSSHSEDCGVSVGEQSHRAKWILAAPAEILPSSDDDSFHWPPLQITRSISGSPRSSMMPW